MRDLEIKGIVRTAVEGTNLSLHTAHTDILEAECLRTFPTIRFPANELLKREEIETLKKTGVSIITALHHGHGVKHRMFAQAPMDLMYGFRGNKCDVDLFSPYEMLLWWDLVRIVPPTRFAECPRSEWTREGRAYTKLCHEEKRRPDYKAGIHYIATEDSDRILLPDILQLCSLRHRWCWEKRQRPHIPTWSFAKVPSPLFSPEENARMLCVYMRPWTLNPEDSSRLNPLLSVLGECITTTEADIPTWTQLPEFARSIRHTAAGQDSGTHTSKELSECYKDKNYHKQNTTNENVEQQRDIKKRRRSKSKPDSAKTTDKKKILMPLHGEFTSTEM